MSRALLITALVAAVAASCSEPTAPPLTGAELSGRWHGELDSARIALDLTVDGNAVTGRGWFAPSGAATHGGYRNAFPIVVAGVNSGGEAVLQASPDFPQPLDWLTWRVPLPTVVRISRDRAGALNVRITTDSGAAQTGRLEAVEEPVSRARIDIVITPGLNGETETRYSRPASARHTDQWYVIESHGGYPRFTVNAADRLTTGAHDVRLRLEEFCHLSQFPQGYCTGWLAWEDASQLLVAGSSARSLVGSFEFEGFYWNPAPDSANVRRITGTFDVPCVSRGCR